MVILLLIVLGGLASRCDVVGSPYLMQPNPNEYRWDELIRLIDSERYADAHSGLATYINYEENAQNPLAWQLLGALALKMDCPADAAQHILFAFVLEPNQPAPVHANYILALQQSGAIDEAARIASAAMHLYPHSLVVHQNAASVLATSRHPHAAMAYLGLCQLETTEHISDSCISAIKLNSLSAGAVQTLVAEIGKGPKGRYRAGLIGELARQVAASKGDSRLHYSAACQEIIKQIHLDGGEVSLARQILSELYNWLQHDVTYHLDMGMLHYFNGEYKSSLHHCHAAAQTHNDSYVVQACLGTAAVYVRDETLALSSLQRALELLDQGYESISSHIFSVNRADLLFNLLSALFSFQRYNVCADRAISALQLPSLLGGGATVLALALVEWSHTNLIEYVLPLAQRLINEEKLDLPNGKSIMQHLIQLRTSDNAMIVPMAVACFSSLSEAGLDGAVVWTEARRALFDTLEAIEGKNPVFNSQGWREASIRLKRTGVILMTQFFSPDSGDASTPSVVADMLRALRANLRSNYIDRVVLFCDGQYDFHAEFGSIADKISVVIINERLSFSLAFKFSNDNLRDKTVILGERNLIFHSFLFAHNF